MEDKKETFNYTYSASEQDEIKRIREKYMPPEPHENKMDELRRLDRSTTKTAELVSLTLGILSALLLGVGMCCTMLPGWSDTMFIPGIVIGLVGICGMIGAYPVYVRMVKKKREKLAPEIMKLTDELMK